MTIYNSEITLNSEHIATWKLIEIGKYQLQKANAKYKVAWWRSGLTRLSPNSVVAGWRHTQGIQENWTSAIFLCDCVKVGVLKITVLALIWSQCECLSV